MPLCTVFSSPIIPLKSILNVVSEEERAHGTISSKTYLAYLREGVGSLIVLVLFISIFVIADVSYEIICTTYYII